MDNFNVYDFIVIAIYFLPTIVAGQLDRRNGPAIFVCNLFFGWTVLGWIVTLIWALAASRRVHPDGIGDALAARLNRFTDRTDAWFDGQARKRKEARAANRAYGNLYSSAHEVGTKAVEEAINGRPKHMSAWDCYVQNFFTRWP